MPGIFEKFFSVIPEVNRHHAPGTPLYNFLKDVMRREVEKLFHKKKKQAVNFPPFGCLSFPYHRMGTVDTLNLFDLDELIIFSFYWQNRYRYRRVLDIGANLGLHSVILAKCGYKVDAYEPDRLHFRILKENLALNNISGIKTYNMAVSDKDGAVDFIRVLGNTTGSHIAGAKPNPYGKLEKVSVKTRAFKKILKGFDLVKMDVEGFEKTLIVSTGRGDWKDTDALVSVHDAENAQVLFKHFNNLGINLFSQKIGWRKAVRVNDMPMNHHEGSLFVSARQEMAWPDKT
ncbi:MAG: hypothetical protein A2X34_10710 [Elusimicrobia bacterium GWC2_51_8]|nr:MAG: hypothetical protein A2X33_09405 [Elusimicrobia bacterium GWA2_51_34]OGR62231.1 MAG: hypothetical protein A2X34_10710 [Elusimicrobia bacterium GWC2_51_8]OGR88366.1 MAG: hypothetical protein A2021_01965 [Elusimicrobia bacterium GWF2_52_66]HAF94604.1 FkbM family methyltransferase [Elusimicrobiota bacterium]HCE98062.1 FkbM family methyltransferase [Elusimicrobiota bacterium]